MVVCLLFYLPWFEILSVIRLLVKESKKLPMSHFTPDFVFTFFEALGEQEVYSESLCFKTHTLKNISHLREPDASLRRRYEFPSIFWSAFHESVREIKKSGLVALLLWFLGISQRALSFISCEIWTFLRNQNSKATRKLFFISLTDLWQNYKKADPNIEHEVSYVGMINVTNHGTSAVFPSHFLISVNNSSYTRPIS